MDKINKKNIGKFYEDFAVRYLQNCNYRIIERNYRSKFGEIDIIAYDKLNNSIVFVEVRYRKNISYGTPAETVTRKKQYRILMSAVEYIKNKCNNKDIGYRFDVLSCGYNNENLQVEHIKNAFQLDNKFTI